MRRMWAAALAPALAVVFLMLGSAPASAFGGEVLGCGFNPPAWTANSCAGADDLTFAVHNLSGTYTYAWTITNDRGTVITRICYSGGVLTVPCIQSGCTATSSTCELDVYGFSRDITYTASLRLTQAGLSRTLQAQALAYADPACRTC